MIKSENGQLRMLGRKEELKLEYMQMLDAIKNSDLFSCKEEMEAMTLFVLMNKEQQKECVMEMLDEMIKDWEKLKK